MTKSINWTKEFLKWANSEMSLKAMKTMSETTATMLEALEKASANDEAKEDWAARWFDGLRSVYQVPSEIRMVVKPFYMTVDMTNGEKDDG